MRENCYNLVTKGEGLDKMKRETTPTLFHNLFIRYGAGLNLLVPLTKVKWWNAFAWTSIVLGVAGWALFLYFFPAG
jgi:hypothetical protein